MNNEVLMCFFLSIFNSPLQSSLNRKGCKNIRMT